MGGLVIIDAKLDVPENKVSRNLDFTLKGSAQIIFNADEGLLVRNESNQYVEIRRSGKGPYHYAEFLRTGLIRF